MYFNRRDFLHITKSGRVWRKVPESDARSVAKETTRPPGLERLEFRGLDGGARSAGRAALPSCPP